MHVVTIVLSLTLANFVLANNDSPASIEAKFRAADETFGPKQQQLPCNNKLNKILGRIYIPKDDNLSMSRVLVNKGEFSAQPKEDGSFEVGNLQPGSYVVEVSHPRIIYEPIRVDISSKCKTRARKLNQLKSFPLKMVDYPLEFKPITYADDKQKSLDLKPKVMVGLMAEAKVISTDDSQDFYPYTEDEYHPILSAHNDKNPTEDLNSIINSATDLPTSETSTTESTPELESGNIVDNSESSDKTRIATILSEKLVKTGAKLDEKRAIKENEGQERDGQIIAEEQEVNVATTTYAPIPAINQQNIHHGSLSSFTLPSITIKEPATTEKSEPITTAQPSVPIQQPPPISTEQYGAEAFTNESKSDHIEEDSEEQIESTTLVPEVFKAAPIQILDQSVDVEATEDKMDALKISENSTVITKLTTESSNFITNEVDESTNDEVNEQGLELNRTVVLDEKMPIASEAVVNDDFKTNAEPLPSPSPMQEDFHMPETSAPSEQATTTTTTTTVATPISPHHASRLSSFTTTPVPSVSETNDTDRICSDNVQESEDMDGPEKLDAIDYTTMFHYTIFVIVCVSLNILRSWLMNSTSDSNLPDNNTNSSPLLDKEREESKNLRLKLGLKADANLKSIAHQLQAELIVWRKRLEFREKVGPYKRKIRELKNSVNGADYQTLIQDGRYLSKHMRARLASAKKRKELLWKVEVAKHDKLKSVNNYCCPDDLLPVLKGIELKDQIKSIRDEILEMNIRGEIKKEQIATHRKLVKELAHQLNDLEKAIEEEETIYTKLDDKHKKLKGEHYLFIKENQTVDSLNRKTDDKMKEAYGNYKLYIFDYHKVKSLIEESNSQAIQ